jgi:predicted transcriptional regulator
MIRSTFEIIAEMLRVARQGAKKTHIMYSCNLSYGATEEYLTYLLETGLLKIGNSFHTTDKGIRFLRAYQTLDLLLTTKS